MTSGAIPVLKSHESDTKNINVFYSQENFLSLFNSLRHLVLENKNIHITILNSTL